MNKEEKKILKNKYAEDQKKSVSNKRNCYCSIPKIENGPIEYCGTCAVCGEPGHTRHHPGTVPYTGGWCDYHYKKLAWTHPTAKPGFFVWMIGAGLIILLYKWI